jgi:hypothetical protein
MEKVISGINIPDPNACINNGKSMKMAIKGIVSQDEYILKGLSKSSCWRIFQLSISVEAGETDERKEVFKYRQLQNWTTCNCIEAKVKYGGRSPNFIWAPYRYHVMCVAVLIG